VSQTQLAGDAMLRKISEISAAMGKVATDSTAMGAGIAAGLNVGANAADLLISKYRTIIDLQAQMANVPMPGGGGRSRAEIEPGVYQYSGDQPGTFRNQYGNFTNKSQMSGEGIGAYNPNFYTQPLNIQASESRIGALNPPASGSDFVSGGILAAPPPAAGGRGAGGRFLPGNTLGQFLARDSNGQFLSAADWQPQLGGSAIGLGAIIPEMSLMTRPNMGWSSGIGGFGGGTSAYMGMVTPNVAGLLSAPQPQVIGQGTSNFWGGGPWNPNPSGYNPNVVINQGPGPWTQGSPNFPGGGVGSTQYGGFAGGGGMGGGGFPGGGNTGTGNPGGAGVMAPTPADVERTSMFERILGRIILYTAIFETFRLAASAIRQMTDEMLRLEDVSARVGFITGQGVGGTQAAFTSAAQYGISPKQAGPAILAAAQLGATSQQQTQANQLGLLYGPDQVKTAIQELIQVQGRADASGLKNVQTMDFLAQSYKTFNGTLKDSFGALETGITLHAQFGVSAEAAGLAIERTSTITGQSVDQVGVIYQRILSKVQEPATQDRLKAYGIVPGTTEQMVSQISTRAEQYAKAGTPNAQANIQGMMEAVMGGGIGGYSAAQQIAVAFKEMKTAMDNATPSLAKFGEELDLVSNTGVTKINQLTSAWAIFLQSLGNTSIIKSTATALTDMLNAGTAANQLGSAWSTLDPSQQKQLLAQFTKETGLKTIMPTVLELAAGASNIPQVDSQWGTDPVTRSARNMGLDQWLLNRINGGNTTGSTMPQAHVGGTRYSTGTGIAGPGADPNVLVTQPPAFGGFETFPKGENWDKFVASTRKFEGQISAPGMGYTLDQKQYQYYDETTGLFRSLLADSNAIRFATDEQRKLLQQAFTGTFNVPAGGRIPFAALLAGFGPQGMASGLSGGAASPATDIAEHIRTLPGGSGSMSSVINRILTDGRQKDDFYNAFPGRTKDDLAALDPAPGRLASLDHSRMTRMHNQSIYDADPYGIRDPRARPIPQGAQANPGRTSAGLSPIQLAVTNNIRINIDGRQIAAYQNKQTYRQFESVRNSNGAPSSVVSM